MASNDKKILVPIDDEQKVARALLSWLNGFPEKPVRRISFEHLESDSFGVTVISIQSAYKIKTYMRGKYKAQYQFQIMYRKTPDDDNSRLEMDEFLNGIAAWAENNPDKPELEGKSRVISVSRDSGAAMQSRYEDGSEDHAINMNLIYEVI